MAIYILTPEQLNEIGILNSFEIPASGSGGDNTENSYVVNDYIEDYFE